MNKPYKPKRSLLGKLVDSLLVGDFPKRVWNKILKVLGFLLVFPSRYIFSYGIKVDPKKIMFMTYSNNYFCNPKYICEELVRRNTDHSIVWAVKKDGDYSKFPENARLVIRNSAAFYREQASSKIWVDNALCFMWSWFPKKRKQVYFQTWHGSMGLKRIGAGNVPNKRWVRIAKKVGRITDYCISNSVFEDAVFRETYWHKTRILPYGHARNDHLVNYDQELAETLKKEISERYGFDYETRLALYAPTFRDNETIDCFDIDFDLLCESLSSRFGGKWLVLARHHFHNRKAKVDQSSDTEEQSVINVTKYSDIQDLLLIADVGITDYSSWICDFVLTQKPAFIYARDLEEYNNERGMYYPLETTPFPIAEDNDGLAQVIATFNEVKYKEDCERFLLERGSYENGTAAKRIVDEILRLCE
ncbi:MAG: CDP-glycerol glycerophosphotransferase family protein [Coriobacteriia bacterium]|nr:CDP-glycerol glycerophosphotransferase family protein [Coriobacteriia bacterium]